MTKERDRRRAKLRERQQAGWYQRDSRTIDGVTLMHWDHRDQQRRVFISLEDRGSAGKWKHVSVSHRDRYPTWDEIIEVKELFLGKECSAMQLIPPRSKWLNLMENCFHLWHRLDGDTYPPILHDD